VYVCDVFSENYHTLVRSAHMDDAHMDSAHMDSAHMDSAHMDSADMDSADMDSTYIDSAYMFRKHIPWSCMEDEILPAHLFTDQCQSI